MRVRNEGRADRFKARHPQAEGLGVRSAPTVVDATLALATIGVLNIISGFLAVALTATVLLWSSRKVRYCDDRRGCCFQFGCSRDRRWVRL